MKFLLRVWDDFWLSPEPARNLAAARIVFAAHALWILASRDLAANARLPAPFFEGVSDAVRWRYLIFGGSAGVEPWLQALAAILLVAFALGIRSRYTGCAAALLLYHLAPLETVFWTPGPYQRGLTITVPAVLALAYAGRAPWGLRLSRLLLAQIYFFAGYSKLVRVGLDWMSASNLQRWLHVFNEQDQIAVFQTVGPWLAEHPSLCLVAAWGAVLFELAFPLAVFLPGTRRVLIPGALVMHAGVLLSMNIAFLNVPQLLVFVDWNAIVNRLRHWRAPAAGASAPHRAQRSEGDR